MPAVYRFEVSTTKKAGCRNTACKKEGVKIQKGEMRMGTLVTIYEHDSWHWKHWGCVSPRQLATARDQLGGDKADFDDDGVMDCLDGWDELPDWAQDKLRQALKNGHVDDEDWRGEPELNRPGKKGINKRTPKKKAKEEDDEVTGSEATQTPSKPKARKPRGKKVKSEEDHYSTAVDEETAPVKKKRKGKNVKAEPMSDHDQDGNPGQDVPPARKKRGAPTKRKAVDDEDEVDVKAEEDAPVPAKRPKAKKEEKIDDDLPEQKPKRRTKVKEKDVIKTEKNTEDAVDADLPEEKPKRKPRAKKEVVKVEEQVGAEEAAPGPSKLLDEKPKRKPRTKKAIKDKKEGEEADPVMTKKPEDKPNRKPRAKKLAVRAKQEAEEAMPELSDSTEKRPENNITAKLEVIKAEPDAGEVISDLHNFPEAKPRREAKPKSREPIAKKRKPEDDSEAAMEGEVTREPKPNAKPTRKSGAKKVKQEEDVLMDEDSGEGPGPSTVQSPPLPAKRSRKQHLR